MLAVRVFWPYNLDCKRHAEVITALMRRRGEAEEAAPVDGEAPARKAVEGRA